MEWDEQPLALPRHPLCRQALLQQNLKAFSVLALRASLSPTALDRKEGYLLSTTHSVLALFKVHRGLGCDGWDSNPRFPAYEAGDLATSLPRNINYFSHFGIIIISQFCLFVKIRER